jgi:hypothetical protein
LTSPQTRVNHPIVTRIILSVVLTILSAAALVVAPQQVAAARWVPAADASWQIQFSGPIDLTVKADAFDLDMFETTTRRVRRLHNNGKHAVCYINAGAWEDWRPDADRYPSAVLGKPLDGWPGERWLDIRRIDILGPIIGARLDRCDAKGFDGVEFDNVEGYQNSTGFGLRRADQLTFNRWLADAAHARGLSVGLKNALGIAEQLEPKFDFAIVEQCFYYRECGLTSPFTDAGKSVLVVEYELTRAQFCDGAKRLGVTAMRKHLSLDAWRRPC